MVPDPPFYPWFVIVAHLLNIVLLLMLGRSGIEVLSSFPKLYWHDSCPPGREWARFSRRMYGADSRRPWTTLDEEEAWNPVVAMPGHKNLGIGRHWHFLTIHFWIATGIVYLVFVFASGYWRYLVPTDVSIVPEAIGAIGTYLQFELPEQLTGQPFNAAQKLAYFSVIFLLAPLQIASGAAMSPSVIGRFPWYGRLFGGKQGARSVHFLGMCAFAGFVVVHTAMVVVHGLPKELAKIVLGSEEANRTLATIIAGIVTVLIVLLHLALTVWARLRPRTAQHVLGIVVHPFERTMSRLFTSRQRYRRADISPTTGSTATRRSAPTTTARSARGSPATGSRWVGWSTAPRRCRCPSCASWAGRPRSPTTTASRAGTRSPSGAGSRWGACSTSSGPDPR